ncbi:MAG: 4-hydroxy-tetrahydrodipicolinate synthase [Chloroflexi bacterium]|nr:4-hydroxy-tetrahydrodipicolinate synthase [Chloroflexota bacterium]
MLKAAPSGIIPAMVTPMTADEQLNERSLRRLTNYLIEGNVHGLFAAGSQGESWALTHDEKRRVWETVVDETRGRVPVYAGTAGMTTRQTIELTQLAEKAGADAVSILTPFFIRPNEDELFHHYKAIAESTSLPIVIYSNPIRTNVRVSPGLLSRLAQVQGIVGIKDSSGDLELTAEYIRVVPPGFSVLVGLDTLIYAGLTYGTRGSIAATANVMPALAASIYDRFMAGDLAGALQAQRSLAPLRLAFSWGTYPVVIKEALNLMGMDVGPCRAPVGPLATDQRVALKRLLREMKVL